MAFLNDLIQNPNTIVYRRIYIKRRSVVTGLYEADWFDVSEYVKKWGKITTQLDSARRNKFTFGNAKVVFDNETGKFNPDTSDNSLWYGYLNQQRTLFKIETGFIYRTSDSMGRIFNAEVPSETLWDVSWWDLAASLWDADVPGAVFYGILSGDIGLSDANDVTFNLKPLTSVFQDFQAKNLTGWTSTGMTASQFVQMLRDQTDGSSNFVFRPFFDDTTSMWDFSTTTNVYGNLNTTSSKDVFDATVWEILEKLAEAENFVPYIARTGEFRFVSRDNYTSTSGYEFLYGPGRFNREYGQTIKKVSSFGFKPSKYYSSVRVKWQEANTTTSYETVESTFSVSPTSSPWVLGQRVLDISNLLIPTSTVAQTIAQNVYNDVSGLKREIDFTTTFIPHLDILDRIGIYYDAIEARTENFWDVNNWADDATTTADDLIFSETGGDGILLEGQEFKFLTIEIDLDNFENRFLAREL